MEERLFHLLQTVVEMYIKTAEPVGSQSLVQRERLDVSPATVRNWFAELEEAGYLTQPHVSGGRIPTERGYRVYVEKFVEKKQAAKRERDLIHSAEQIKGDVHQRTKHIAKVIAEVSGEVVFLCTKDATYYTGLSDLFAQPEFHAWQTVVSLTEVLDRMDEALQKVRGRSFAEPTILLGSECPFGSTCAVVLVSKGDLLFGILGPMRMNYQYHLSLLQTVLVYLNK